jgi:hypothetical protein
MPPMLTTEPRAATRCGHAARIIRSAPNTFTWNASTHSSSVNESAVPVRVALAQLTSASTRPQAAATAATARSVSEGRVTSHPAGKADGPTSAAAASSLADGRATMATR